MKTLTKWTGNMNLEGSVGDHKVSMDAKAPLGQNQGMTPKELVAIGLSGCTAMDVVALMKKHKQDLKSLEVTAEVTPTSGQHPIKFQEVLLVFDAKGSIDGEKLKEAVHLSQTKFCGVSAMLSASLPIRYKIILNGEPIGEGEASFS